MADRCRDSSAKPSPPKAPRTSPPWATGGPGFSPGKLRETLNKSVRAEPVEAQASPAPGFGSHSYPIEVGLALDDDTKYCSLILPAPDWEYWDAQAEQVHRIARDILETYGKPIREVAENLNRLAEGKTLYTDGWVVDKPWLTTLFEKAGMEMKFYVSDLEMILSEEQMARWHATKEQVLVEVEKRRHRASFDAWLIQETYKRTLGGV